MTTATRPLGSPVDATTDDSRAGLLTAVAGAILAFSVLAAVEGWSSLPSGTVEVVVVTGLVTAVSTAVREGHRFRLLPLAAVLFAAYSAVALLSVLVARDTDLALEIWQKLVRAQVIGFLAYLLTSELRRLRWFTWGAAVGTGVVSLAALGFTPPPMSGLDAIDINERLTGPLGDANFFAQFLVVGLALATGMLWRERLALPFSIATVVAAVAVPAILATESRGAALAVLAVGLLHLCGMPARRRLVVLAVIAIALALYAPSTDLFERLGRAPSSVDAALDSDVPEDTAVAGRLSENIAAVQMTLDHPVLGVGIGNYQRNYLDYARTIEIDRRLEQRDAHNLHLEVAAETGLIGALVWIVIVIAVVGELTAACRAPGGSTELRRLATAWGLAFAGWFVTSIFLHDNHPELQWLLVGVAFGIGEVCRRQHRAPTVEGTRQAGTPGERGSVA